MIDVCCAIITERDNILIVQRSNNMTNPLKWEFPGGKVKDGETLHNCTIREIREELTFDVVPINSLKPVEHEYIHANIRLHPILCKIKAGEVKLTEHTQYRWVHYKDLPEYDLSAADKKVVVEINELFNSK